jgi:hypothetical protein
MSENHFLLSYGIPVTSRASLGMGLKRMVINSKIGNGAGIGLEFGALYRLSRRYNWTVAAVARDVAANLKNESLNPYYMVGTAYQYHSPNGYHHLAFALDAGTRNDVDGHKGTSWRYAAGMEYLLRLGSYGIALRGGGGTKNYAFGFGLRIGFFAIDYAFTQMRENTIGDSHKFGISFNFGRMAEQEEEAAQAQAKERQALKVTPMRLTGAIRGDRIVLRWDKVRGSDEYKVFGRMPGQKWKSLFEKRLKKTDISINYRQKSRRYEFMVVAVKKGKGIGKSNVWATL